MIDSRAEFTRLGELLEEFLEFKKIQNPPSTNSDLCAFLLLEKLAPAKSVIEGAEHDQIWLSFDLDELDKTATPDDILFLYRCGVFYDEDPDSLSMWK